MDALFIDFIIVSDLSRMYKLLKPTQKGFNAMLQELEGYIADTGLDRVKMLQNENVCVINLGYF